MMTGEMQRKLRALCALCALAAAWPVSAGPHDQRVGRFSRQTREQLAALTALTAPSLADIAADTDAERLRTLTTEILALDSLSPTTRVVDAEGRAAIHRYLIERIRRLEPQGLRLAGSLRDAIAVPVTLERLLDADSRGAAAALALGEARWPVHPFWPNGALPTLCPAEGLAGPLVDVGNGEWTDVDGLDLHNAIALMHFRGGRNWERLFLLGAQAVIVVEDDHVNRFNAAGLFCNTPVPFPRFYAPAETGRALRAALAAAPGATGRLSGGNVYENRPVESFFAYLPPTAPLRHRVTEDDLLRRIAIDAGVTPEELVRENRLTSPWLTAGMRIDIPGRLDTLVVRPGDLLDRLAFAYGLKTELLQRVNGLAEPVLRPGQELTIPNINDATFLLARIDSVSSVPDAPHGAHVAANLAVALSIMEHLATSDVIVRRKGIVFGFMDGDNHGGRASRTLAERLVLQQDEWLDTRFEKARVDLAEARIERVKDRIAATDDAGRRSLDREIDRFDKETRAVADLRNTTFLNPQIAPAERLRRFREAIGVPETAARIAPLGLSLPALGARLRAEAEEEDSIRALARRNDATATALAALAHPDTVDEQERAGRFVLGWLLDLSSGSHTVSASYNEDALGMPLPGGARGQALEGRFMDLAAYAAVAGGWPEDWTYFGSTPHPEFVRMAGAGQEVAPAYAEFLAPAKVAVATLRTINDQRVHLDTPHDTLDRVRFANLAIQARTTLLFLKTGLESHADFDAGRIVAPTFGRLLGAAVQCNIRSGIDAQDPVPRAYVYYPALKREAAPLTSAVVAGMRPGILLLSQLNGAFALPLESLAFHSAKSTPHLFAYRFDREQALFDMVLDQAVIGTQKQRPNFRLLSGRDVEKRLILTHAYPLTLFAGVDPMTYREIPDPKAPGADPARVIDAVLNGPPRHLAIDSPSTQYREGDLSALIVYVPEGRRVRLLVDDKNVQKVRLTGPFAHARDDRGAGYRIGPAEDSRNLVMALTPLQIAEDLYRFAEKRRAQYVAYGIRDQAVDRAVRRSEEKLVEAREHAGARRWQAAIGAARESWGILIKNYPRILGLGREAVFSAVFLMGLLVPASTFLERLLIGAKGVLARLAGATVIFLVGAGFLNQFHPAFAVAVSPFIVMIASAMFLMSLVVLGICYQRFEVLVRRARIAGGEVKGEEISLASSLNTALALGVSNLRKRPVRTALTIFTVSVLTFSIIAFVSVRGDDALLERPVTLERDIEGRTVEPLPPPYEGVLFRNFNWQALTDGFVSAMRTEFGNRYALVARAYCIETEGGDNAGREGGNPIDVRHGSRLGVINGVMALSPDERSFSRLHEAVSGGVWFDPATETGEADRFQVILPDTVASALDIRADMLLDAGGALRPEGELPQVTMLNRRWRVVGILDVAHADRMRDLTGRSLAMVDYLRSGITPNADGHLENEAEIHSASWSRLATVPLAARQDVNAKLRSVAVRFKPGDDVDAFRRDIALRHSGAMFSHRDGALSLLTTRKQRSVGGLARIIVPVILCILIVANTMRGTVEERRGEVEMLGAIGLSPRQISFLLLSEATVFSVLGIVFGAFAGLAFSRIMLSYPDVLGGLSVNFTSLASTGLAMSTGLVVLLATLLPAKRAAAMAAPSGMERWALPEPEAGARIVFALPFTLTRGNAVGMLAFFRRFMLNHTEATSADFNCRDVRVSEVRENGGALRLEAAMWLAPYDLDVAQRMELVVGTTDTEGVFRATIRLRRTSGTEEAWLRTNYAFMDLVRRQFLLWRNLNAKLRAQYIHEGGATVRRARETAGSASAP
jgi:hypothetical protein